MMRFFAMLLLAGVLAGCSMFRSDLTPPLQAYALNKEYQAVAEAALGLMQSPLTSAKLKATIKAADQVAFDYVNSVTEQASAWEQAPAGVGEAVETSVFERLFDRARNAVAALGNLIASPASPTIPAAP